MDSIDWLVNQITFEVRGGRTPSQAYKDLCQMFPEDQVRQALDRFEQITGRIRTLREPTTLEKQGLPNWYPGPSPDDRFWPPLRNLLLMREWEPDVIDTLDQSSTKVVSLLQPPGLGSFKTRGLVLGYVQSGKTANFTAVIAKAADVGYKFFIVLSGITNPLRTQTQVRLERELVDLNRSDWVTLTTPDQDFHPGPAGNVNAFLTDHSGHRVLCVVKKNATVLRRLLRWLAAARAEVLANCPALIIDDEADQATVNASGSEEKRTAINRLLLNLLGRLPKTAYIGYTATPFANVFIDPSIPEDLYPRDFIVDLPKSKDYFGAERIFGREQLAYDDPADAAETLDMIRYVDGDEVKSLKPHGQSDWPTFEPALTDSLKLAMRYFWMATSARAARGQGDQHSSMLIHTTLYARVHELFRPLLETCQNILLQQLRESDSGTLEELSTQWAQEQVRVPSEDMSESPVSFDELLPYLQPTVERTEIVVENSISDRRLAYGETGLVQIIVGGNTLSRGLTLEGLVVSYFVRASTAYDTLLQMGRWFGYRRGYADLPRIWMTRDLEEYFFDLATVEQEMRNDIRRYELEHLTPLDFAVRIRTHPALEITARLKMQAAIDCDVSYGDRRLQTILFNHRDESWLHRNIEAAATLIRIAEAEGIRPELKNGNTVLRGVPVKHILLFLDNYAFHKNSLELRADLIKGYIQAQNAESALGQWNVVIVGLHRETTRGTLDLAGHQVPLIQRSRLLVGDEPYANLGVLANPEDVVADLDMDPNALTKATYADLQAKRPEGIGLLLLYPVARDSMPRRGERITRRGKRVRLDAVDDLIGVTLVFPHPANPTPQRYKTVDLSAIEREEVGWPEDEEENAV